MKKPYFLFFSLLLINFAIAQVTFQKTYGGTSIDDANSIQLTSDGGYIIAGTTASYGSGLYDVYLIKTNNLGEEQWSKTYGGINEDYGYAVQQTIDGGYVIIGTTHSFGTNNSNIYLIKTDFEGNLIWSSTYGDETSLDEGYYVQQTSDYGFILTGRTEIGNGITNIYIVKTSNNGDTLWTKTYGGTSYNTGYSIIESNDNSYVAVGSGSNIGAGNYDICVIKIDVNGNTIWTKSYGGLNRDYGYSIQQTLDNGYIIAGSSKSFTGGGENVYLVKIDSIGNVVWSNIYVGVADDAGLYVQQTSDYGYIITGYTYSFGAGGGDVYLIKTNAIGGIMWSKAYGGIGYDCGYSVIQTQDGGYIIAARSSSFSGLDDIYIIKTDSNGNSGCNEYITNTIVDTANTITVQPNLLDSSGGMIITQNSITKSGCITNILCTNDIDEYIIKSMLKIFPNPADKSVFIELNPQFDFSYKLYNSLGILILANSNSKQINVSDLSEGMYVLEITHDKIITKNKIIINH